MLSKVLAGEQSDAALMAWPCIGSGAKSSRPSHRQAASEAESLESEKQAWIAAAEQRLRQAYESGLREGEATATRKGEAQLREVVERLGMAVDQIAGTRNEALRRAEADMVHLSIEIARRILHRELTVDTSALEALVRAALEKLRSQEVYRVRVHPDQEQIVRACLQQMGRDSNIEVVSDPSRERGGAVFELSRGSLDASVDAQLREIERGLADQLGERS